MPQLSSDLSFQIRYVSDENLNSADKIIYSPAHTHILMEIQKEKFEMKWGYFLNSAAWILCCDPHPIPTEIYKVTS